MEVFIKETVWRKYVLAVDASIHKVTAILSNGTGDDLIENCPILYNELDLNTCHELEPEENNNEATKEVRNDNGEVVWNNKGTPQTISDYLKGQLEAGKIRIDWNDPEPIEGNDYKVNTIDVGGDIATITYNDGWSEAEVPLWELRITKL